MHLYSRRLASAGALVLLHLGACYRLVPVAGEPAAQKAQLVLEFTDGGAQQLGGLLGNAVVSARGQSAAWTPDTVSMSMIATTTRTGGEQFWNGERIAIPRASVARVHERRLDRGRTALFALAGLALAITTQQLIDGSGSGNPRPPVVPPID